MRRSRHTDQEIAFLLREAENGTAITAICAAAHVSVGTFYRWRRRFGGLPPAGVARLSEVEGENAQLRAEVMALQQALLAFAPAALPPFALSPAALRIECQPKPALPSQTAIAPARFRGSQASVGRYAFVRTAN